MKLLSPTNGAPLQRISECLLDDGERRWPVVEGIAYLRPKELLRQAAVAALERNDEREALLLLLTDQDDFSPTAPPDRAVLNTLLNSPGVTLRQAMRLLNYGPVSDYFAYRWCSPTFHSGLRLLELSVQRDQPVVEYACGIGHFLRELQLMQVPAIGVDIVYSKLWLARKFLGVTGPLICGDVERSAVVDLPGPATVFCHDAFYFLKNKEAALAHMRHVASQRGRVAIGHVHTDRDAHAAGHSLSVMEYGKLTTAPLWTDAAITQSFYQQTMVSLIVATMDAPAIGWLENNEEGAGPQVLRFNRYHPSLRLNPLIGPQGIHWPSEGWKAEFMRDIAEVGSMSVKRLMSPEARQLAATTVGGAAVTAGLSPARGKTLVEEGILLNLPVLW